MKARSGSRSSGIASCLCGFVASWLRGFVVAFQWVAREGEVMRAGWFMLVMMCAVGCHGSLTMNISGSKADQPIAIAIHGGAGTITRESMTPEKEAAYRAGLEQAMRAGYAVLERGGTSMDACIAAVKVMEDSPLFNAGKG